MNLYVIRNQITDLSLIEKTHFCMDGQEAIQSVENLLKRPPPGVERPISIMLLDYQMPKKSGLDVVHAVR